jgi:hypothetical protein
MIRIDNKQIEFYVNIVEETQYHFNYLKCTTGSLFLFIRISILMENAIIKLEENSENYLGIK